MRKTLRAALASLCFMGVGLTSGPGQAQAQALAADPLSLSDPFIGTQGGGNTVPGASVPFGFINLSPDTTHGSTNGYDGWSPIVGFSHTHVSGTGGNSKYGNFRVTPTLGPVDPRNLAFARSDETAMPGYYAVDLGRTSDQGAIRAELTATRLVGVSRFTFPAHQTGNILLDVTSAVQLGGNGPRATAAHVEVLRNGDMLGWASFTGGWSSSSYKLYFYAVFDQTPVAIGTWTAWQGGAKLSPGAGTAEGGDQRQQIANRLGSYARFDAPVVTMKLAVSFLSSDKARANLTAAAGDFDAIRSAAEAQWRNALGRIEVTGGTSDQRRIFYSALYRSHTMPHDLSGENVWWASSEPHYEDFYTLWDTFRTLNPLLTVIQPQRERDMIRSLLDTYDHTGWLPDARIAGANGSTQGGSNGDVLIADAVVKHLGGFDLDKAYAALQKDGDVDSDDPMKEGRALKDYLAHGYMSLSETRSASRTLEYAYDDFAISEVADALNHKEDAARFRARSANWKHLWDKDRACIHPRYADGSWLENYDCAYTYPDSTTPWWDAPYYEGSGLQYSTFVPQDIPGLISAVGGRAAFVGWLDHLFDGHYDQGNEPDILAPYLYIAAGRPDKTDERARVIMAKDYHDAPDGLPGNDDAGAMSSWYVWSAIGLYPNAGQPVYYIGSPLFTRTVLHLEGDKTFTIRATTTSDANLYVVGARLNGQSLSRAWISHDELAAGGVLELDMADKPTGWGSGQ